MSPRAIWKGVLRFADLEVPVRLHSAARDAKAHFRLLDPETRRPVHQRMVDPRTGEPVEEVRRGYEVAPGRWVLISDEELAALEPEADRSVEVVAFVSADAIDAARYERPYWLSPDGDPGSSGALAEALADEDRVAIVRWAMRKRRYVGAVRAEDGRLALSTLRRRDEVIDAGAVEAPSVEIDAKEGKLAQQLIEALADEFDVSEYRSVYRDRVVELLDRKARGEEVAVPARKERPKPAPADLSDALAKSLEAAKRERRERRSA